MLKRLNSITALLAFAMLLSIALAQQPTSFNFDHVRYTFYPGELARTWDEADEFCKGFGKELAVFKNRGQIMNVSEYLSPEGGVWTGYKSEDGKFAACNLSPDFAWKRPFGMPDAEKSKGILCGLLGVKNGTGIRPVPCTTKKAALCAQPNPTASDDEKSGEKNKKSNGKAEGGAKNGTATGESTVSPKKGFASPAKAPSNVPFEQVKNGKEKDKGLHPDEEKKDGSNSETENDDKADEKKKEGKYMDEDEQKKDKGGNKGERQGNTFKPSMGGDDKSKKDGRGDKEDEEKKKGKEEGEGKNADGKDLEEKKKELREGKDEKDKEHPEQNDSEKPPKEGNPHKFSKDGEDEKKGEGNEKRPNSEGEKRKHTEEKEGKPEKYGEDKKKNEGDGKPEKLEGRPEKHGEEKKKNEGERKPDRKPEKNGEENRKNEGKDFGEKSPNKGQESKNNEGKEPGRYASSDASPMERRESGLPLPEKNGNKTDLEPSSDSTPNTAAAAKFKKQNPHKPVKIESCGTTYTFFPNRIMFGGYMEFSRFCEDKGLQPAVFTSKKQMEDVAKQITGLVHVWTGYSTDSDSVVHSVDEMNAPWRQEFAMPNSTDSQSLTCGVLSSAPNKIGVYLQSCASPHEALCSAKIYSQPK